MHTLTSLLALARESSTFCSFCLIAATDLLDLGLPSFEAVLSCAASASFSVSRDSTFCSSSLYFPLMFL